MVESTTYMDSVAAGELVPQVTLNKLANPDEEWTALEIGDILYRQMTQWYGDLSSNAVSIFTSDICNISLEKNSKFVFFCIFSMTITILQFGGWVQRKILYIWLPPIFPTLKDLTSTLLNHLKFSVQLMHLRQNLAVLIGNVNQIQTIQFT